MSTQTTASITNKTTYIVKKKTKKKTILCHRVEKTASSTSRPSARFCGGEEVWAVWYIYHFK